MSAWPNRAEAGFEASREGPFCWSGSPPENTTCGGGKGANRRIGVKNLSIAVCLNYLIFQAPYILTSCEILIFRGL